jgi:hypothetical protein
MVGAVEWPAVTTSDSRLRVGLREPARGVTAGSLSWAQGLNVHSPWEQVNFEMNCARQSRH